MADTITANPHLISAGAATYLWKDVSKHVRLMQWVDDNADVANGNNLIMEINGTTLEATIQIGAGTGLLQGAVVWEMRFDGRGFPIYSFNLTVMTKGSFHIWFA